MKEFNKQIKRQPYKEVDRSQKFSTKNEPSMTTLTTSWKLEHLNQYPNMYKAYNGFRSRFNIDESNFILTNGCENALPRALQLFKDEVLYIENPTWGMVEVACEAWGVKYAELPFHYKDGTFLPESADGLTVYTTDTYNNLFKHKNVKGYSKAIIDETYTMRKLMSGDPIPENEIYIGSFSKFAGCGIRLGYILFNEKHADFFHLLREQYLNPVATDFVCRHLDNFSLPEWDIPKACVSAHSTYETYEKENAGDLLEKPHKEFTVDEKEFIRIGRKLY